jgi:hypothetical protein
MCMTMSKQLHDGHFPKKEVAVDLELFVEKFIIHSLSAPHKHVIPKLMVNYAHVIYGACCITYLEIHITSCEASISPHHLYLFS